VVSKRQTEGAHRDFRTVAVQYPPAGRSRPAKAFYSPRQIVELIHVIGLYMLFVRVSEVAELELDVVIGGDFWKKANEGAGVLKGA